MNPPPFVRAAANSNIALVKYWGKLERPGNYPAVPSLSLTLADLTTTTELTLDASLPSDVVELDGEPAGGRALSRVVAVLDRFRDVSNQRVFARVRSQNDFPTAAGLASSASGFAALVTAANQAFGSPCSTSELSALARAASASAARSLFGGWSVLEVGAESAAALAPVAHWPLVLIVAVTASGKKSIGSTEAMNLTRSTSPYYSAWLSSAQGLFEQARDAVLCRDLPRLGEAMERSTLMMHATMITASPSVLYWCAGTLNVMRCVQQLRERHEIPCYFTMDAGPHVKVLCHSKHAEALRNALSSVEGVSQVMVTTPGPAARILCPSQ
jgi:diphosphomevalonate decarboxylase